MTKRLIIGVVMLLAIIETAPVQYQGWQNSGSLYLLTTPEGANLPALASEDNFPVLIRLNRDWFDFSKAKPNGEDIRFATGTGTPLAYRIEEWDPASGTASIWVRVPEIKGNARQEIKMHWGNADAASESNGKAVFNESNGYVCVLHLGGPEDAVKDEVGTVAATNHGATPSAGIIGQARHFMDGQYLHCGDKITGFPTGSGDMTTEAWIRAERQGWAVDWGHPGGAQENGLRMLSPAVIKNDCWLNGVEGKSMRSLGQGAGTLQYTWLVSGVAVKKETAPGKLILQRAYTGGRMTVTLAVSNGGAETVSATKIVVKEPTMDGVSQWKPAKGGRACQEVGLDGKLFAVDIPVTPTKPRPGGLAYHLFHPGEKRVFPADTNCAFYWKGRYHLHYIYYSAGYSFAHVSSKDMVHWRWHPTTLTPPKTGHGMFSGTGFYTKEGKPVMIYNGEGSGKNYIAFALDDQLEKWSAPMAIEARVRPGQNASKMKQGDPDCWLDGETYYALSGGTPHALVKSTDLVNWDYVGMFMSKDMPDVGRGEDISCANFFPIGNKWMLLCISHSRGARYYLGDWKNEKYTPEVHRRMNWKNWEFFAPESLLTPDGRRVMWAWCHLHNAREKYDPPQGGIQSLPRELSLPKDGVLRIKPLHELESLRYNEKSETKITVESDSSYMLRGIAGDTLELKVVIKSGAAKQVGVQVYCDNAGTSGFPIAVEPESKTLAMGDMKIPFEVKAWEMKSSYAIVY